MKNWNIIYKAELSNETTFLVFSQIRTNRLKYKLIHSKYKTPADLGLIDLVNLPDCMEEVGEKDRSIFSRSITTAPSYNKPGGIKILNSIYNGKTL